MINENNNIESLDYQISEDGTTVYCYPTKSTPRHTKEYYDDSDLDFDITEEQSINIDNKYT